MLDQKSLFVQEAKILNTVFDTKQELSGRKWKDYYMTGIFLIL